MIVCFVVIGILCIAVAVILLYYNKAFPEALRIADEMQHMGDDYYFFGESNVGFIIFAGAKTDERAYTYIAKLLHEEGHTVIIPKQKFYLSAFGTKHGMELMSATHKIEKWILIGHSLGGMPVSRIAAARPEHLTGVAFLATYASIDLSKLNISAIRITAENDGIMNNEAMEKYQGNLPKNSVSVMLKGANHQGFAAYSSRSGRDGKAAITWKEQNEQTVRLILDFFDDKICEGTSVEKSFRQDE